METLGIRIDAHDFETKGLVLNEKGNWSYQQNIITGNPTTVENIRRGKKYIFKIMDLYLLKEVIATDEDNIISLFDNPVLGQCTTRLRKSSIEEVYEIKEDHRA